MKVISFLNALNDLKSRLRKCCYFTVCLKNHTVRTNLNISILFFDKIKSLKGK